MEKMSKPSIIEQFNEAIGLKSLHHLVSVIDFSKVDITPQAYREQLAIYAIFLKEVHCGNIKYGCSNYDYDQGTLLFLAPGQVYGIDPNDEKERGKAKVIIFHPDLIAGTPLGRKMNTYSFFSYNVNEALHLSDCERNVVNDCFAKILYELEHPVDKHSRTLIVSYIELLLNYSVRFYNRQFITRKTVNEDILARFEQVLDEYFSSNKPLESGLPTVTYCADKLHISTNYLGDLVKRETGKSAQENIQQKVVEIARTKIFDEQKNIAEIAGELGYTYPQHFSRMFKRLTGYTPREYKNLNEQV